MQTPPRVSLFGGVFFNKVGIARTALTHDPYSSARVIPPGRKATMYMPDDSSSLRVLTGALRGKWTLPVLYSLKDSTRRYGDIRRSFPSATEKVLIKALRHLEQKGFVKRRIYPSIPPKVEYRLTSLGLEVLAVVQASNALASKSAALRELQEAPTGASFLRQAKSPAHQRRA